VRGVRRFSAGPASCAPTRTDPVGQPSPNDRGGRRAWPLGRPVIAQRGALPGMVSEWKYRSEHWRCTMIEKTLNQILDNIERQKYMLAL